MIHDIVTNEGDLDHCVKADTNVYIVLKCCVDGEKGKLSTTRAGGASIA